MNQSDRLDRDESEEFGAVIKIKSPHSPRSQSGLNSTIWGLPAASSVMTKCASSRSGRSSE